MARPNHCCARSRRRAPAPRARFARRRPERARSLLLRVKLAQAVRTSPSALDTTFVALEDHAAAALASLREVAHGICPLPVAKLGVAEALRAQATRAPITVSIAGTTARSTDHTEKAIYLCCSEAIQNVTKHAGPSTQVKLGLHTSASVVQTLAGTFSLISTPGHGTVLTISLPWPPRQPAPIPRSQRRPHQGVAAQASPC